MYMVGHAQECHAECHYTPYVGINHRSHIQLCSTQIDVLTMAFFGNGDGGWGRQHSGAIAA